MTKRSVLAACTLAMAALALCACATGRVTAFDGHLSAQRWQEAAAAFDGDSALLGDPDALLRAAMLFGTPGRATYHPERAADLLRRLLVAFPETKHGAVAAERLALLAEVVELRLELQRLKEIDLRPRAVRPRR